MAEGGHLTVAKDFDVVTQTISVALLLYLDLGLALRTAVSGRFVVSSL